ncbi:hypothetical protein RYX36_027537 [Vicia faba]
MDPTNHKKQQEQEQERQLQKQEQENCSSSTDPSECDVDSTKQRLKEHGLTKSEVSSIFGNDIQGDQRTYIENLFARQMLEIVITRVFCIKSLVILLNP